MSINFASVRTLVDAAECRFFCHEGIKEAHQEMLFLERFLARGATLDGNRRRFPLKACLGGGVHMFDFYPETPEHSLRYVKTAADETEFQREAGPIEHKIAIHAKLYFCAGCQVVMRRPKPPGYEHIPLPVPADTLAEPLGSCKRCKMAYYCSKACQVNDWTHHKALCRSVAGLLEHDRAMYKVGHRRMKEVDQEYNGLSKQEARRFLRASFIHCFGDEYIPERFREPPAASASGSA